MTGQPVPKDPTRVYVDSSVFGGAFDEMLLVAEVATVSEGAIRLQQACLAARIVGQRAMTDALHVAVATATRCDAIVSWNFHHIVNFGRIPKYNAVNVLQGFRSIAIHSPQEVLIDEDEDV